MHSQGSSMYSQGSTLREDACAQSAKDLANQSMSAYYTTSFLSTNQVDCAVEGAKLTEHLARNPTLTYKAGVGNVHPCFVDQSSLLTRDPRALTHGQRRQQLCVDRWSVAVPNLDKGGLVPGVHSRLINGDSTASAKRESQPDRFVPMIPCVEHHVRASQQSVDATTAFGMWTRAGGDGACQQLARGQALQRR